MRRKYNGTDNNISFSSLCILYTYTRTCAYKCVRTLTVESSPSGANSGLVRALAGFVFTLLTYEYDVVVPDNRFHFDRVVQKYVTINALRRPVKPSGIDQNPRLTYSRYNAGFVQAFDKNV